jgi:signal transduction histidine kinase
LNTLITEGQVLTSGIRLREDEVLELIRVQASKLMDTDNMYIALYDKAMDTVRFGLAFVDGKRIDVAREEGWQPRRAGKGRTEEIIRTEDPILTTTKKEAEAWYAQPEHKDYIKRTFASWLGVPMIVGEKVLGVIATYHTTQDYVYTEDDLAILQAMANQAAIALDNAHMFYDVNRRLGALVEFGQTVTSGIRLREDEILELIYSQASKLMDTDNMYIALYDETTETVRFGLGMVDGKRVNIEAEKGWESRRAGKGRTEEIIRTKKPMLTTTKAEAEAWYAQPEHKEYWGRTFASWLGVPMMVGERILGVIATYHPTRDYVYSGDDLEILQAMASLAAIAIDNAKLTYGLEQAVEERTRQLREEQGKSMAAARLAAVNTVAAGFVHRMGNVAGTIPVRVEQIKELLDPTDPNYSKFVHLLNAINEDVEGILKAARAIQTSTTTEPLELVNIDTLVSTAVQRIAAPSTISVCSKCDPDLPPVLVFSGQFVDTLENIIRNGIEAIESAGSVIITCRTTTIDNQDFVAIGVRDTGHGIPPENLPKIFDLFFSTKGGMGFALWRAKTLVESLGGKITVESEVGKGTLFTILLPAAKEVKK